MSSGARASWAAASACFFGATMLLAEGNPVIAGMFLGASLGVALVAWLA